MSDNYDGPQMAQKILRQQAEIERLRGLVAEKDTQLSQIPCRYNRCIEYAEAKAEIERLRGLSDITRLDVMWQELVRERYAAENNAAVLAAEVQNLRSEIERLRRLLRNGLTSNIPEWKQRVHEALGEE